MSWGNFRHWIALVFCVAMAGLVIKFPEFFDWPIESYLQKNIGLVLFPWLTLLAGIMNHTAKKYLTFGSQDFYATRAACFIGHLPFG